VCLTRCDHMSASTRSREGGPAVRVPRRLTMSNREVFTPIARCYDMVNAVLSLGRDQVWRRSVISSLPEGDLLDLGSGTGAANEIFGSRRVVAVDPSFGMLERNHAVRRVAGAGEALPLADSSFDAVFSAYVVRNLDSVERTLSEVARILRPGGKLGIIDLARPISGWQRSLHRVGTAAVLPTVGLLTGAPAAYWYLHKSLDKLPPPERLFGDGPMTLENVWRMGPMGFVYVAVLARR
jgi:demethylmenaquinone methyltransferase/2-methoxy-6-polyprenyl-1,4-benzoquinol methylase